MKKLFAMLLAVAMVFSLAACGSNPSGENSQPPVNGGNEESAEPSQAPSEAPSEIGRASCRERVWQLV